MPSRDVSVTHHAGWLACGRPSTAQLIWAGLFLLSLVLSSVASHVEMPAVLRYALPIASALVGLAYVRSALADLRRQSDELQLRIYLEASAVTCHGLFIALLVYPVFEKAHMVGPIDYSVVLFLLIGMAVAGYLVAVRRYR